MIISIDLGGRVDEVRGVSKIRRMPLRFIEEPLQFLQSLRVTGETEETWKQFNKADPWTFSKLPICFWAGGAERLSDIASESG